MTHAKKAVVRTRPAFAVANGQRFAAKAIGEVWPLDDEEAQNKIIEKWWSLQQKGGPWADPEAAARAAELSEYICAVYAGDEQPLTRSERIANQVVRAEKPELQAKRTAYAEAINAATDENLSIVDRNQWNHAQRLKGELTSAGWDWGFDTVGQRVVGGAR